MELFQRYNYINEDQNIVNEETSGAYCLSVYLDTKILYGCVIKIFKDFKNRTSQNIEWKILEESIESIHNVNKWFPIIIRYLEKYPITGIIGNKLTESISMNLPTFTIKHGGIKHEFQELTPEEIYLTTESSIKQISYNTVQIEDEWEEERKNFNLVDLNAPRLTSFAITAKFGVIKLSMFQ